MCVRKIILRYAGFAVLATALLASISGRSVAQPVEALGLPDILTDRLVVPSNAPWTIRDIVEVQRIKGTAIQGTSRVGAFIIEQPSLADGTNHYGLYELDPDRGGGARKLAEANYMADLSWRPNTAEWTVRADFGLGVQLYSVKRSGVHEPLLLISDTVQVGGSGGILLNPTEGARMTGVVSYGWSADGRRFWFARLRHKDKASQDALLDSGVIVDGVRTFASAESVERATTIADYELRVFDTSDGSDCLVAKSSATSATTVFGGNGGVAWVDSTHLQYRQLNTEAGVVIWSLWRFDLASGKASRLHTASGQDVYSSTPTPAGYLAVHHESSTNTLVEVALDGHLVKRYGEVNARSLVSGSFWRSGDGNRFIYGTESSDRDGLSASPESPLSKALSSIPDFLSACSFNADLSFGLCSQESLSKPPALVSISGSTGEVSVIVRPNARYDAIQPLQTIAKEWTNRFGAKSTGYITYPRAYVPGRSYPALVVTHGADARNRFAWDGFQWEFPIQAMAEQGYFILSVNEPKRDPSVPEPEARGGIEAGVNKQEFNTFVSPAATMEAAVEPLIAAGAIIPNAVGIAGYSHGAETAYFVMSHSTMFSAASFGDDTGIVPSYFFLGGTITTWMKAAYGGSPYDAAALENYRNYSTSFRIDKVKTPLLEQFASTNGARAAQEVHALFRDAGIPSEIVDYVNESHIFYAPRHRATAMVRNLDWFNYWLLDLRDPDPAKADQYSRWDAMATRWRHSAHAVDVTPGATHR